MYISSVHGARPAVTPWLFLRGFGKITSGIQ
jgi:hypothetical protein